MNALIPLLLLAAQDDPSELARAAISKTADKGGLVLKGKLDRESPFAGLGVMLGGMGGAEVEGDLTVTVGRGGTAAVVLEGDRGRLEVYRKGKKSVQRQTWTGKQPSAGEFADEVTRLIDLDALKTHLAKAKEVRFDGEKKIGDAPCRVVKATLPAALLGSSGDGEGGLPFSIQMFEVKDIRASFCLDKETGELRAIELQVNRGYSSMIRSAMKGRMPGMEEEDEEEEAPDVPGVELGSMKFVATYAFTVEKNDPDLVVEIPADLRRFFEE